MSIVDNRICRACGGHEAADYWRAYGQVCSACAGRIERREIEDVRSYVEVPGEPEVAYVCVPENTERNTEAPGSGEPRNQGYDGRKKERPAPLEPNPQPVKLSRRRGVFGCYTPEETLEGWRKYQRETKTETTDGRILGNAVPLSALLLKRPANTIPNATLRMFWHVEGFLLGREQFRAGLLAGDDLECCAAFSSWWQDNPFQIWRPEPELDNPNRLFAGEKITETTPLTLSEACEMRGIKLKTALEAIRVDKLHAWRPQGSPWMTRLIDLDRWQFSDQRKKQRIA